MIITNAINLSAGAGKTATNAYLKMVPHVGTIQQDGKVPCDLFFYYSEADSDSGADKIYPLNGSGAKITAEVLQFTTNEVVKVGANCTMDDVFAYFKTKLKAVLESKYGWSVTV